MYRLPCAGGVFDHCQGEKALCKQRAGFYLNRQWDICPMREVAEDTPLQIVLSLDNANRIAPIAQWPDSYAAWVPRLWAELKAAKDDRIAHENKEA